MKKIILFLSAIFLLFIGCNKNSEEELLDKINEITKLEAMAKKMSEAKNDSLDSILLYVAKIQKIIDRYETLPDTFLIENGLTIFDWT